MAKLDDLDIFARAGWVVDPSPIERIATADNGIMEMSVNGMLSKAFLLQLTQVDNGRSLAFSLDNDDRMTQMARVLISHQPELSASNYRDLIHDLVATGGVVKALINGEHVLLSNDDGEPTGPIRIQEGRHPDIEALRDLAVACATARMSKVKSRRSTFEAIGVSEISVDAGLAGGVVSAEPTAFGRWYSHKERLTSLHFASDGTVGAGNGPIASRNLAKLLKREWGKAATDKSGKNPVYRWSLGDRTVTVKVPENPDIVVLLIDLI